MSVGPQRISTPPYTPHYLRSSIKTLIFTPLLPPLKVGGETLSNTYTHSAVIFQEEAIGSKLSFLRSIPKGFPEKLKQTAYFSLIRSFMEYGATLWDPYQKYNSDKVERMQRQAARLVKSRCSRYSSGSDMIDVLGWTPLSQRRQEARLILFYKIINGLARVPFEDVLVEGYKGTIRKHNMKFRQIGHTTSQYVWTVVFPKTISAWNRLAFAEALSLAVFRSNFILNERASLPYNTLEGSCRILNQNQPCLSWLQCVLTTPSRY